MGKSSTKSYNDLIHFYPVEYSITVDTIMELVIAGVVQQHVVTCNLYCAAIIAQPADCLAIVIAL